MGREYIVDEDAKVILPVSNKEYIDRMTFNEALEEYNKIMETIWDTIESGETYEALSSPLQGEFSLDNLFSILKATNAFIKLQEIVEAGINLYALDYYWKEKNFHNLYITDEGVVDEIKKDWGVNKNGMENK